MKAKLKDKRYARRKRKRKGKKPKNIFLMSPLTLPLNLKFLFMLYLQIKEVWKRWFATHLKIQIMYVEDRLKLLYIDLQSLTRFEIPLALICSFYPHLKSPCPNLKSLLQFVIFLPRFEKVAPICSPSLPRFITLKPTP